MSLVASWADEALTAEELDEAATPIARALAVAGEAPDPRIRERRTVALHHLVWWADQTFRYGRDGNGHDIRILSDIEWAAMRLLVETIREWRDDGATWADVARSAGLGSQRSAQNRFRLEVR